MDLKYAVANWRWMAVLLGLLLLLGRSAAVQAQSATITPTATPTPTTTPITTPITPPITTVATVRYNTNLRAGPGAAYPTVGKIRAGEVVTVIATSSDGNWVQVEGDHWIAVFFLEGTLPVLRTPASPTTASPTTASPTTASPTPKRLLIATATAAHSPTRAFTATSMISTPLGTTVFTATLPTDTIQPTQATSATALRNANLRAGPGTNYAVTGGVSTGDALDLQGRTSDYSWFQLRDGSWIAAFLVEQNAPINATALPTVAPTVIAGIPTTVPTTVPTSTPIPQPIPQPAAQPTQLLTEEVAPVDAVPPTPTVEPNEPTSSGTTTFVVTRRRLWNPWENGGSTDGPSVHCGQGRTLVVTVLDEFGGRLNNVAVQAEYGAKEVWVTGSQGKGDGIAEFVLGGGQDVRVIRDADGSPVSSEAATGLSTDPRGIDQASLISAGYCQDDDSCRTFVNNLSCISHYSWSVTFERRR